MAPILRKGREELILTEALIDALTFWCAGYRNVTSAYGAGGFTEEILEAMIGHGVKRVLIAYDRDAAGDKSRRASPTSSRRGASPPTV